jgi:hypothetical protein
MICFPAAIPNFQTVRTFSWSYLPSPYLPALAFITAELPPCYFLIMAFPLQNQ